MLLPTPLPLVDSTVILDGGVTRPATLRVHGAPGAAGGVIATLAALQPVAVKAAWSSVEKASMFKL
jgi:hypothetical protein